MENVNFVQNIICFMSGGMLGVLMMCLLSIGKDE